MSQVYSGVGTLYMRPLDSSGAAAGDYVRVGEAYPLSVKVSTNQIKKKSRMVATAGQTIGSKVEIDEIAGSLTLHEAIADNLAWALSGSKVALTGTSGSVSDEAVTAPAAGEYVKLTKGDISSVVVTTSPAGTTYVENTDYIVDTQLGLLTIVSTGDISEDDALLVSFDYAAESGYKVNIGTSTQIRVQLLGHLRNEFTQADLTIELDDVVLSANQEINFISEDGSEGEQFAFDMTLNTPSGQTSPGRVNGLPLS